jgi:arsenite methyltransferase
MSLRDTMLAALARQLSHPGGLFGRMVAVMLNKGNRGTVTAAVQALDLGVAEVAVDVGFGGGLSLALLLDRVGAIGCVHGVDISSTVLSRAARRYRTACSQGRLRLHAGSLTDLPLGDAEIDALITVNTIYFVPDLHRAFVELSRVLKPSGRVVIGLGDPDAMAAMPVTRHGFALRPVQDVAEALAKAGLTVIDHRRVGVGGDAFHLLIGRPSATAQEIDRASATDPPHNRRPSPTTPCTSAPVAPGPAPSASRRARR